MAAGDGEDGIIQELTLCPKMPLQKPLQDAAKKSGAYLGASSPAKHFTCATDRSNQPKFHQ